MTKRFYPTILFIVLSLFYTGRVLAHDDVVETKSAELIAAASKSEGESVAREGSLAEELPDHESSIDFSTLQITKVDMDGSNRRLRRRKLANNARSTDLLVTNSCSSRVRFGIVFRDPDGEWVFHRWYAIKSQESLPAFSGVTDTTVFVYAVAGGRYIWDGDSDFCLLDSRLCFKQIDLGTLQPAQVSHSLTCNSGGGGPPTPVTPPPDAQKFSWLMAHNIRREAIHVINGLSVLDLEWSDSLARDSRAWARELARTMSDCSLEHDQDNDAGENIASNWGTGIYEKSRTPDEVLKAWFDEELALPLGPNGHFTQVAWRATHHVGCGEAQTPYNGGTCYFQVCRYIRPGNCNLRRQDGRTWLEKMLADTSPCSPFCPAEGCRN